VWGRWMIMGEGSFSKAVENAFFCDVTSNELCGSHVESGIKNINWLGSGLGLPPMDDFVRVAIFDRDFGAGFQGHVYGGPGGGNVKGDVMIPGKDGDAVGSDFIGGIAVGCDAIGSDHDLLYGTGGHYTAGHVIAYQSGGDGSFL